MAVSGNVIAGLLTMEFVQGGQRLLRTERHQVNVVPEPGSVTLLLASALPLAGLARRRCRRL